MTHSRFETVGYWLLTTLVAVPMFGAGIMYLTQPSIAASFAHLGYPSYIIYILGPAKLLGAVGLLNPFTRLREWAYAGFTFMFIGAVATHLFAGDPASVAAAPLIMLVLLVGSYVLNRRRETAGDQESAVGAVPARRVAHA